jgi:membrane protein DedA with SNARE-associated domain
VSQFFALIAGTFASEDLTTIGAGLLIREGSLGLWLGLAGCYVGIVLGDLGLWLAGRSLSVAVLGRLALDGPVSRQRARRLADWLDQRPWQTVFAARFLPGTRVPLYLAAGLCGRGSRALLAATLLAALVWTPLVVLAVAIGGSAVRAPLEWIVGPGWPAVLATAVVCFVSLRVVASSSTELGRARLIARVARLWRWEFWPTWLFYLPLVPWLAWLCLRHRSATVWTAANPGILHGGFVGESKHAILEKLPAEWTAPSALIAPGPLEERVRQALQTVARHGWTFPVVLKPDVGQRGAGFRLARRAAEIERYLATNRQAVILQAYAPGPCEAGVFYARLPGQPRGRVFSITDKVFPELWGDSRRTLEELIWGHPRFRMQAATFLRRHEDQKDRVLVCGERFALAAAGNHCQGTLFRDGSHLWTPELERRIDEIAQTCPGFYFGRFDLRYQHPDELRQGRGFSIVELNGVTSESTNVYDPQGSLLGAYGTLGRQWAAAFCIGAENRRRGHRPARLGELWAAVVAYRRRAPISTLAD